MTNAVILSAGQGKRLSPLTDSRPKCLIEVGGRTVLHWQLHGLAANGVARATVVTGFGHEAVEAALRASPPPLAVETLYNPFYHVADNIGSCWLARDLIGDDSLLLNGDTLFEPAALGRVLAEATAPVTVTADAKPRYDADDMKIRTEGDRLTAIGKTLADPVDGESIGLLRFLGEGGRRFGVRMLAVLAEREALKRWYLSIIHEMAQEGGVGVVRLRGERWCELDFPTDLPAAEALAQRLRGAEAERARRAV